MANNKKCPLFEKNYNIKKLSQDKNLTFKAAKKQFNTLTSFKPVTSSSTAFTFSEAVKPNTASFLPQPIVTQAPKPTGSLSDVLSERAITELTALITETVIRITKMITPPTNVTIDKEIVNIVINTVAKYVKNKQLDLPIFTSFFSQRDGETST
jgi:hypothetical protein